MVMRKKGYADFRKVCCLLPWPCLCFALCDGAFANLRGQTLVSGVYQRHWRRILPLRRVYPRHWCRAAAAAAGQFPVRDTTCIKASLSRDLANEAALAQGKTQTNKLPCGTGHTSIVKTFQSRKDRQSVNESSGTIPTISRCGLVDRDFWISLYAATNYVSNGTYSTE